MTKSLLSGFEEMTEAHLRPIDAPILGHVITYDSRADQHHLLLLTDPIQNLYSGTREDCESARVQSLLETYGAGMMNVDLPTLGGAQVWGDVFVYERWRIQRNLLTQHCRLLDANNIRRAWGSYEECRAAFETIKPPRRAAEERVVLLHGLGRRRDSLRKIDAVLRTFGYETVNIGYPSTRADISAHAERVERILDQLPPAPRTSFVTHSLGGLVARTVLARTAAWRRRTTVASLVMMAAPNRGCRAAGILKTLQPFLWVAGPAGLDATPERAAQIPHPECRFGIIAGGTGSTTGYNPFLRGDNDGLICIDEATLPGAADRITIRSSHTWIMDHPEAIDGTLYFLRHGEFARDPVSIPSPT
jgi:hypothetical protein